MKILLTIHEKFDPNSGAAGSIAKLGAEYQKLGHEVHYLSMDDLPKRMHRLVKRVLFPEFVAARIASISAKSGLDIVDASTGDIWFWVQVLQKFSIKPPLLVTRSHGLEHLLHQQYVKDVREGNAKLSWKYPLYRGSIYLSEIATSLKSADLVYLLNRQEREYVTDKLGVKAENIHLVANGIPETFLNLPFESLSLNPQDTIRIAQIGTYIPRKGIKYGSPAINAILLKYPNVEMTFWGQSVVNVPVLSLFMQTSIPWFAIALPLYRVTLMKHYPLYFEDIRLNCFPLFRKASPYLYLRQWLVA